MTLPDFPTTEGMRTALSQAGPIPNSVLYNNGKSLWEAIVASGADTSGGGVPVGTIIHTGQSAIPAGFLDCDGSSQLRSEYQDLFNAIGTTYGPGAVSGTTFALPTVVGTYGNFAICANAAAVLIETQSLIGAPIGTLLLYAGATYPTGWLRADGSAISRTTYANLFAIIGTTYGAGDGSTTFNLPNLASSGIGSPVYIIKAILSGSVEPSTVAHAASHIRAGTDVIDADRAQIDFVPTYYTRNAAAPEAGAVTDLTAHLSGISAKLYNNIVSFNQERNGVPVVGYFYSNGNGAIDTLLTFPFACELIGATLRQNAAANGAITVQMYKNLAVNASYALTSSGASGNAFADWRSTPLAFAVGDSLAWRVSAVTSTTGSSAMTFFMRITAF